MLVFRFVHLCCLIGFIVGDGTWRGPPKAMNFTTGAAIPIPPLHQAAAAFQALPTSWRHRFSALTEDDIARPEPIEARN